MVIVKPDNVMWYIDAGSFTFIFSKELLSAIRDCANSKISILLGDIERANRRLRFSGLPTVIDSFAGVTGDSPDRYDSVKALFERDARARVQ